MNEPRDKTFLLQVKGWHLAVIVLALAAPWAWVWQGQPREVSLPPLVKPRLSSPLIKHCRPGPWGEIEYARIVMEPPLEFAEACAVAEDGKPRWFFKDATREQVLDLLRSAKLTSNQWQTIQTQGEWSTAPGGEVLQPPRDWVFGLAPESRSIIYSVLADYDENPAQHHALCYRAELVEEWLGNAGLQPATLQLIRSLMYQKDGAVFLGDVGLAMSQVPAGSERQRLAKALYRQSSLLVKLRMRSDARIDELVAYWSRGGRTKDVRPLLESIPTPPEGFTIDIGHLLPKFARAHINTYPLPNTDIRHDCHWAALNFLNFEPREEYADQQRAAAALMSDYYTITGNPLLGDILVFIKPNGEAIHSCVYVADNIVFTKNGRTSCAPWVLMELADVQAFYAQQQPFRVVTYRQAKLG